MHIVGILGPVVVKGLLVSLHAVLKFRKGVIELFHVPEHIDFVIMFFVSATIATHDQYNYQ